MVSLFPLPLQTSCISQSFVLFIAFNTAILSLLSFILRMAASFFPVIPYFDRFVRLETSLVVIVFLRPCIYFLYGYHLTTTYSSLGVYQSLSLAFSPFSSCKEMPLQCMLAAVWKSLEAICDYYEFCCNFGEIRNYNVLSFYNKKEGINFKVHSHHVFLS